VLIEQRLHRYYIGMPVHAAASHGASQLRHVHPLCGLHRLMLNVVFCAHFAVNTTNTSAQLCAATVGTLAKRSVSVAALLGLAEARALDEMDACCLAFGECSLFVTWC
jgi:hypothetical protein